MPAEASLSVTVKSAKGDLHTLRGDSWDEFVAQAHSMLGAEADAFLQGVRQTFKQAAPALYAVPDENQAVQNIQAAMPGSQPVSTVGQPLPVPQPAPQPVPAAAPPTVPYPGDCAHGVRQYKDSVARGKPWRRWECAIPWSKDNAAGRCKPINVES